MSRAERLGATPACAAAARAHAPRLVQRVAVRVVQDHKLRRRHAEHVRAVVAPTPLSHHVIAAPCARASTSLSAREHAHNQQAHVIVRAGADAGAGCVVRVSGLRTASYLQGALQPSLIASADRCARRAGCTPITRSSHAERTRPGQLRSGADEAFMFIASCSCSCACACQHACCVRT